MKALPLLLLFAGVVLGQGFDPAATCDQSATRQCWQALDGRVGCYVWKDNENGNAATWTGACSDSLADGAGVLTWLFKGAAPAWLVERPRLGDGVWAVEEGRFVDGQRTGLWVVRYANGDYAEQPYVDGKRHGTLMYRRLDRGARCRLGCCRTARRTPLDPRTAARASRSATSTARDRTQTETLPFPTWLVGDVVDC